MSEVVLWTGDVDEARLDEYTLDELAQAAVAHKDAVELSLATALGHFVQLGMVLLVANSKVPKEQWDSWCEGLGISKTSSNRAMRMAHHRKHLPKEAWQPWVNGAGRLINPTVTRAEQHLRGLPPFKPNGFRYGDEIVSEVRRLKKAGVPQKDIAEMFGVNKSTVSVMVRPGAQAKYAKTHRAKADAKRKAERIAAKILDRQRKQEERAALASALGGDIATAYALIRRLLSAVDRASSSTQSSAAKVALVESVRWLHTAEHHFVKAMQAERMETR